MGGTCAWLVAHRVLLSKGCQVVRRVIALREGGPRVHADSNHALGRGKVVRLDPHGAVGPRFDHIAREEGLVRVLGRSDPHLAALRHDCLVLTSRWHQHASWSIPGGISKPAPKSAMASQKTLSRDQGGRVTDVCDPWA